MANVIVLGSFIVIKQLLTNELPLSGYVPRNIPYLFGLMAFVQIFLMSVVMIPFITGADLLFVALCSNLESQYDILMADARNILEENHVECSDEAVLRKFKKLVKRHNFLLT